MRMPTITNDGINQNGVLASVHVVLTDGIDDMSGTNEGGKVLDGRYVVRYVLDHAKSAQHAVALLEQANIVGGFEHYGLHWMIADEKDTYIVEVIEGRLSVSRNEYNYFTNFYMNYGPDSPPFQPRTIILKYGRKHIFVAMMHANIHIPAKERPRRSRAVLL